MNTGKKKARSAEKNLVRKKAKHFNKVFVFLFISFSIIGLIERRVYDDQLLGADGFLPAAISFRFLVLRHEGIEETGKKDFCCSLKYMVSFSRCSS